MTQSADPGSHRLLAGASRVKVLEHLRDGAAATVDRISDELAMHPNTVRFHLDQLLEAGLVTRAAEQRPGPGRPRWLYSARPAAPVPEAESYRALAGLLAGQLEAVSARPDDDAAAAGRAWGRTLTDRQDLPDPVAATDHLVRLMDRLGFAPAQPEAGGPVELHRCPFREVAERHSRVVCGIHLGLMQGALERVGAPLEATRLEPFVTPDLCLAHLAPLPDAPLPNQHAPLEQPTERNLS